MPFKDFFFLFLFSCGKGSQEEHFCEIIMKSGNWRKRSYLFNFFFF